MCNAAACRSGYFPLCTAADRGSVGRRVSKCSASCQMRHGPPSAAPPIESLALERWPFFHCSQRAVFNASGEILDVSRALNTDVPRRPAPSATWLGIVHRCHCVSCTTVLQSRTDSVGKGVRREVSYVVVSGLMKAKGCSFLASNPHVFGRSRRPRTIVRFHSCHFATGYGWKVAHLPTDPSSHCECAYMRV